jgi:Ca-activated chloride channel family protein
MGFEYHRFDLNRSGNMIGKFLLRILILGQALAGFSQIPLDSLHGAMCGMLDPETKQQVAISPSFTRVNVVVTDAIAQAVVTQTFVNPFRAASEAVYLFPLPDQGAVHGMKYEYRGSVYTAKIMDRDKAQAKYDSIKQTGGQAALLLQERPNIFMQRMASIGPGETAYVEIRLSMPLKYADGGFELSFPTRIGPRFQSGAAKKAAASVSPWNPPEDRSGPEFQFNVLIQSGVELGSIYSPSHPIEVAGFGDMREDLVDRRLVDSTDKPSLSFSRAVMLKTQTTYPNRDFALRMKRAATASDFSVALSKDSSGQGYFMLDLYPDPTLFEGRRGDMELVLLIDISGSQTGWPLEREKEIALNILSRLGPGDNIDVLSFSDNVTYAFGNNSPVPASAANVAKAETFIRGLATQGGTQLLDAVNAALAVPADRDKQRYFAFLTDGFITNESAILEAISRHPSKPTIFTFGAGNNLNRYFLEECAKVGNGFATEVTSGDAAGPLVESAWKRIDTPQLEGITVDFGGLAVSDVLPPVSNRLYAGLPYRLIGKYDGTGVNAVTLKAQKQGVPVNLSHSIDFGSGDGLSWAVPKLWAREKIGQLMLAQGTTSSNKAAVIRVSEDYQVLSNYTAFLASEPQPAAVGNPISGGIPTTGLEAARGTMALFDLSLRGSLLMLDWKTPVEVESIVIYDPAGKILFAYRPGSRAPAIGRWVWDGRDAHGAPLGRGRYLISVKTYSGVRSQAFLWNPLR